MDFASLLPTFDRDELETISLYSGSCNTGFTGGTRPHANVSGHAKGRMLERDIDDLIVRRTMARGQKSPCPDGKTKFELNGVVVIASCEHPDDDQVVVTTWADRGNAKDVYLFEHGWVLEETYKSANEQYSQLLQQLDDMDEPEDREAVLRHWLAVDQSENGSDSDDMEREASAQSGSKTLDSYFHGIDLERTPPNRPLLLHCAEKGYGECVKALIEDGHFNPGITGSKQCTLLHMAAWTGQSQVLEKVPKHVVRKLVDVPNEFNELPEELAWSQYCIEGNESFLEVAVQCRNLRLGVTDSSKEGFVQMANETMRNTSWAESVLTVPCGAEAESVIQHFESAAPGQLVASAINCARGNVNLFQEKPTLSCMLKSLESSMYLETIKLECCGLTATHCETLSEFLQGSQVHLTYLGLKGNTAIGDEGLRSLCKAAKLFDIDTLSFVNVGLSAAGLQILADGIRNCCKTQEREMLGWRKLNLSENDLSCADDNAWGAFARPTSIQENDNENKQEEDEEGVPSTRSASSPTTSAAPSNQPEARSASRPTAEFMAALRSTLLADLDLSDTSLRKQQFKEVLDGVRELPLLEVLGVVDNLICPVLDQALKLNVGWMEKSPRVYALRRINLDCLKHPSLWQDLQWKLLRMQKKQQQQRQQQQDTAQELMHRCIEVGWQQDDLPNCGRIGLQPRMEDTTLQSLILHTKDGQILLRDEDGLVGLGENGLPVRFAVEYNRKTKILKLAGHSLAAEGHVEHSNKGCLVVFYREETNEILVEPALTPHCIALAHRFRKVLPAKYDLESRFGRLPGTAGCTRPSTKELMSGLELSTFSDREVAALATLNDPSSFADIMGKVLQMTEISERLVERTCKCPEVVAMVELFRAEQIRRQSENVEPIVTPHNLLTRLVFCDAPAGLKDDTWYFPPLVRTTVEKMLEGFAPCMRVTQVGSAFRNGKGSTFDPRRPDVKAFGIKDTVSSDGSWFYSLAFVGVSEELLDPRSGQVLGMCLVPHHQRQPPRWVRVDDTEALKTCFSSYVQEGFEMMPHDLQEAAAEFKSASKSERMDLAKVDLGKELVLEFEAEGKSKLAASQEEIVLERSSGTSGKSSRTSYSGYKGRGKDSSSWRSTPSSHASPATLPSSNKERHPDGRPKLMLKPRSKPLPRSG
mmetsp:Transcript_79659/g.174702  ORF Transcript_79659/g.174702 Transcript_79659/m.174702 type:complete len:1156 (+) Transcript_79659:101-3568(+)